MVYFLEFVKFDFYLVVVCNESCEVLFGCSKKSVEFWIVVWLLEVVIYFDVFGGIIIIIIIIEEEEGFGYVKVVFKLMICIGLSGCWWLIDWLFIYILFLIYYECCGLLCNVDDWMNEWCVWWRRRGIWRRRRRKLVVSKMRFC